MATCVLQLTMRILSLNIYLSTIFTYDGMILLPVRRNCILYYMYIYIYMPTYKCSIVSVCIAIHAISHIFIFAMHCTNTKFKYTQVPIPYIKIYTNAYALHNQTFSSVDDLTCLLKFVFLQCFLCFCVCFAFMVH